MVYRFISNLKQKKEIMKFFQIKTQKKMLRNLKKFRFLKKRNKKKLDIKFKMCKIMSIIFRNFFKNSKRILPKEENFGH